MLSLQNSFFAVKPTGIPLEKGRLLVSVPFNSDGYFDRTVILLVEHNSEGAMGFILNRPMHVYLKDVLPDLSGCRHVLHNGGPVGLETLAATINEEAVTLEDMYEPYLLQQGFLTRTPRGRCVTRKAYEHLGIEYMGQQQMEI